jgi:hypothetical protein
MLPVRQLLALFDGPYPALAAAIFLSTGALHSLGNYVSLAGPENTARQTRLAAGWQELEKPAMVSGGYDRLLDALLKKLCRTDPIP